MKKHKIVLLSICIILTVAIASLFDAGFAIGKTDKPNNTPSSSEIINPEDAIKKVTNIINKYFVKNKNATASGKAVEENGLYKVRININDSLHNFYLTKNGAMLIFPDGFIDIAGFEEAAKKQQASQIEEIPRAEKPVVELFVMSLCPYGVKAEQEIFPVISSYGHRVDFKIKFLTNIRGDTIDKVSSLHGNAEVREDARQAAIMKYYPKKLPLYIDKINEKSCVISCGAVKLEDYWKKAAKGLGMNIEKIESFAYGQEGINSLRQDEADAKKYKANASPTLVINGKKSNAIYRGKKALKETIDAAFINTPD